MLETMQHDTFLHRAILVIMVISGLVISEATENVALSKPTSQSTFFSRRNYDSAKAVDGSYTSNIFHSGLAVNNWLKIHLMDRYTINKVVIYNCIGRCPQDRLRGYQVSVYNSGDLLFTYNDESESPESVVYIDVPYGVIGDEVKLSIPGREDYLSIREVEVVGELYEKSVTTTNIAFSKLTSQSSILNLGHLSSKAVDGETLVGIFSTNKMYGNFWKVHLWNVYDIQRVMIYNRLDEDQVRLRGYQIDIYNSGVSSFTSKDESPEESPGSFIIIDVPEGTVGNEVRLSLPEREEYIQILEVEVYGSLSSGYMAISDENVALLKPTTQSAPSKKGTEHDSTYAVDGDASSDAILFRSGYESRSTWLKVHLINLYDIQRVVIYNQIGNMKQLQGYQVDIYNCGVFIDTYKDKHPLSTPGSVVVIDFPAGTIGDEVKLSIPERNEIIVIRELEVYGEISSDLNKFSNVALSKPTSSSSSLVGYESSHAVDGDKYDAVLFKTELMDSNWLKVDLEDIYLLKSVVVYNSLASQSHLRGYQVEVFMSGVPVFTFSHRNPLESPMTILYIDIPVGVKGDEVKLSIPGRNDNMHIREVEIYGRISSESDPDVKRPLFPTFFGTDYVYQQGIQSTGTTIVSFDRNDYVTYPLANFGPSGTTKSIRFKYSKDNVKGRVDVRLGGRFGTLIGTFSPMNSDGVEYITANLPIDLVDGVHDITLVGKDVSDVWYLKSLELSESLVFQIITDYKVSDDDGDDAQCNYAVVMAAYNETVFKRYYSDSTISIEDSFSEQLGVNNKEAAQDAVYNICRSAQENVKKISLESMVDSQFIELFYAGRTSWNEETQTNLFPSNGITPVQILKQDAYKVAEYKDVSEKDVFEMPNLPQFDHTVCKSHAAQCCWPRDRQANDNNGDCVTPYDSDCVDKDVMDNTDLCYNELDKAPYTNGIDASGFSIYSQEGPVHCHGFAWATEEQEITTRYKANALFFVSMYDHMYQRGYVENIPGSPMCGCVEHMPIVTRADCTQTNVQEYYTFYKNADEPGFNGVMDGLRLTFQTCQGADNKNNDLRAFVQQLVNDGKLSTDEQDIFNGRVVGNNKCSDATNTLLNEFGFQRGYNLDESKWTYIVGEGFEDKQPILNDRLFQEMIEHQEVPIIRRVCPTCVDSHRNIYYRRLTPIPEGFDLLDTLMSSWTNVNNVLNNDFALYSTNLDAYFDTNRWTFCNYNEPGIGFPRDCGPSGKVESQWNSYIKNGGQATHHAFLIQVDQDFKSDLQYTNVALSKPTLESSTFIGNTLYTDASAAVNGDKSDNAAIFHSAFVENNWMRVYLEKLFSIGRIVIYNRYDCCQTYLRGYQVGIYKAGISVYTYNHTNPDASPGSIIAIDIPEKVVGDEVKLSIPGRSEYISIREVEVYGEFYGKSAQLTNVALFKPTLQSSIGANNIHDSSKAVDGNKSDSAILFESALMENNWWRVYLEDFYTIRRVVIYNRHDCCVRRLRGYQVDIYLSGVAVHTYNDARQDTYNDHTIVINFPAGVIGDEVKVSIPERREVLNLREVEVYGEFYGKSAQLTNVAFSKPTRQSSIFQDTDTQYDSSKAVDGDKSDTAVLFQSGKMENNWWRVYLQNIYAIRRVVIYNLISNPQRLNGYQVDIYLSGVVVYTHYDARQDTYNDHTIVIDFPGVVGDDVKISVPEKFDYMQLREVEVYGQCDGLTKNKKGNKSKLNLCSVKITHSCGKYTSENPCNFTDEGLCEWKENLCSHVCHGLKNKEACKKKKTSISNKKMCLNSKVPNPCHGIPSQDVTKNSTIISP